jgi:hypothetical protein
MPPHRLCAPPSTICSARDSWSGAFQRPVFWWRTLLERGTEADAAEAEAAIERLAAAPADDDLVMRDIWLSRSRAMLAKARGDVAEYARLRDSYRDLATSLGFEGHIDWAEAMP